MGLETMMPVKSFIPQLPNPELPDAPVGAGGEAKALAAFLVIGTLAAIVLAWKRK